jgi:hypothetical protein
MLVSRPKPTACALWQSMPWFQFRVWQLALLVAIVALVTVDIQNHGRREPILLTLAAGGYAAYFVMVWLSWLFVRRFEARVGRTMLLGLFMFAMGILFLAATIGYLVIEYVYLTRGRFLDLSGVSLMP